MMNPPILNPTCPINPLPTTANKTSGTHPPPLLPSISPFMKGMRVCHWLKE